MDKFASAILILWFVIGMIGAVLQNEHGYWRALMFGVMGPFAFKRRSIVTRNEDRSR